jgi:hypothetical protein
MVFITGIAIFFVDLVVFQLIFIVSELYCLQKLEPGAPRVRNKSSHIDVNL